MTRWRAPSHTVVMVRPTMQATRASPAVTNFRVAAPTMPAGISMVSFRRILVTDPECDSGRPSGRSGPGALVAAGRGLRHAHYYPDARGLIPPDCQYQLGRPHRALPAGGSGLLSIPGRRCSISGRTAQQRAEHSHSAHRGQQAPRGWNLIGNPYDEPVSWGSVQFVTGGVRQDLRDAIAAGVTEGVLFEYRQGVGGAAGFYDFAPNPTTAMMEPRKGYWLHVNRDTRVVIYGAGVGGAGIEPTATASTDEGWLMTLSARAGDLQDPRT